MNSNIANMYSIGHFQFGQHISFAHALAENNVEFETTTHTEYGEGAFSMEIITFYVDKNNFQNAKKILKKVQEETPEFKSYPKFKKLFWKIFISFWILFIVLFWAIDKFGLLDF